MIEKEQNLNEQQKPELSSGVMRSFSIEDLRKAFEDAKKGGIESVPVVIDQYGSVNIEEHYVANLYKTFEDWYEKNYA